MKYLIKHNLALFALLVLSACMISGCMDLYDEEEVQTDFTVTFHGAGGVYDNNGEMLTSYTQSFHYGVTQALTENQFEYDGYEFVGWATEQNGAVRRYEADELTVSQDMSLYAVWKKPGSASGINVTMTQQSTVPLFTYSIDGSIITFTGSEGFTGYMWYLNTQEAAVCTEQTYSLDTSAEGKGSYRVTLFVTDSSNVTSSFDMYIVVD